MAGKIIFRNPLSFQNGTGFTTDPFNTEVNALTPVTFTYSIGQAVSPSSSVVFGAITSTDKFTIDNGSMILSNGGITGSFTQTGYQNIQSNITVDGNVTIDGILIAEKVETEVSQAVTLFESGSTLFGDTLGDVHYMTGSMYSSGSLTLNAGISIIEISNDTTLADESTTAVVTENAVKTYLSDQTNTFDSYHRKSFAHTGSYVAASTASFYAVTASAPSGFTATNEDDFMFFVNGAIAEHDALTVQQSGSKFYMLVNNNSVGYDLESDDEIVAWGKFDNQYYLDLDGLTHEVTTTFSGSSATWVPVTYSWWMKSDQTTKNYAVFGYGNNKKAFTTNFSSNRPLMWNASNWYVFWDDTSAQDDGEWHHWMLYNQPQTLSESKLYVDGVLIDINLVKETGTLGTQNQSLTIGSYQNNSTNAARHFSGSIREFAVFGGDKTGNASLIYNSGVPYNLSDESDLQGYWRMNEGSGTTVTDLSGEGNDGTIDGATWNYVF